MCCCWRRTGRERRRLPSWSRADCAGKNWSGHREQQNGTAEPKKDGSASSGEREQADGTPDVEQIGGAAGTPRARGRFVLLEEAGKGEQEAAELGTGDCAGKDWSGHREQAGRHNRAKEGRSASSGEREQVDGKPAEKIGGAAGTPGTQAALCAAAGGGKSRGKKGLFEHWNSPKNRENKKMQEIQGKIAV